MNIPPPWMSGPPNRLLLATDLSPRSDRAFDRAAQLADQWQAELIVLNVEESTPQAPDLILERSSAENDARNQRMIERQLQRDLAGLDIRKRVQTARGDVANAVQSTAADADCGLIVIGVARNELFGRFLPGSTAERLARAVPQPLLVVRNRARGVYRRIIVATDFSPSSRHALHAAIRFFPDQQLTCYHAFKIPLSGISSRTDYTQIGRDIEQGEYADFLAGSDLQNGVRDRLQTVIEHGSLESTLTRFVRENDVDLVIMGTHGCSGLMHVLLGSTAEKLLNWLPCDTLIIRDPQASSS